MRWERRGVKDKLDSLLLIAGTNFRADLLAVKGLSGGFRVQPKYSDGAKVKIRARTAVRIMLPNLARYEDLSGKVLRSSEVVAFFLQSTEYASQFLVGPESTLFMYTVELDEGPVLNDVTEYFLEEIH